MSVIFGSIDAAMKTCTFTFIKHLCCVPALWNTWPLSQMIIFLSASGSLSLYLPVYLAHPPGDHLLSPFSFASNTVVLNHSIKHTAFICFSLPCKMFSLLNNDPNMYVVIHMPHFLQNRALTLSVCLSQ